MTSIKKSQELSVTFFPESSVTFANLFEKFDNLTGLFWNCSAIESLFVRNHQIGTRIFPGMSGRAGSSGFCEWGADAPIPYGR